MQSKSETANQLSSDPHSFQPGGVYSEPWWRGVGYNPVAQTMSGANSSSLDCPNGDSESNEEGQSLSNSGMNEEDDDAAKDSQPAAPNQPGALDWHFKLHLMKFFHSMGTKYFLLRY